MKPADPHKHILGNRLKKAVSILFAALFVIPVSGCILQNPLGLKNYEITVLNDTDGSKNREGYEEIFYWEQPYTVKITVEPNDVDVYWSCDGAANPKFDYDRATESLVRRREVDLKFNGKGTGWIKVSCHNSNSSYQWMFNVLITVMKVTVLEKDTNAVLPRAKVGFTNRESRDYVDGKNGSIELDWYGMDFSGDMIIQAEDHESVTIPLSKYEDEKLKELDLGTIYLSPKL